MENGCCYTLANPDGHLRQGHGVLTQIRCQLMENAQMEGILGNMEAVWKAWKVWNG